MAIKKVTFDTNKNNIRDEIEVNIIKEKLFIQNSIARLESEMNKHGINLTKQDVIEEYQKCYQIQNVVDLFDDKYEKELNVLFEKNILFDDDCIFLFIEKVIKQNFNINEVPDPDYIAEAIEDFEEVSRKKKYSICLNILNNIKNISKYTTEKDIDLIFEPTGIDINFSISTLLGIEMANLFLDFESTKQITNLVFEILDLYKFEYPEQIYQDALTLISRHGFEFVKTKFEEGLIKYPSAQIALYNSVMIEMNLEKEKDIYLKLYEEVKKLPIKNDFDKDYIKIIEENYQYEINNI